MNIQVLIIEDDPRIAEINRRFIEKVSGFEVTGIATNEPQAKELMDILTPDLVLLDVYFPDMSGLDFMDWIQKDYATTDVIMITAAKEVTAVREAIRKGAFDYLVKPLIFERFQETMLRYKQYREKLVQLGKSKENISQDEIDRLLQSPRAPKKKETYYPKGIDHLTLEKVTSVIDQQEGGLTAEEVSQRIGASRSTARRYLEYLVSKGEVLSDLSYGVVGRPERIYRRLKGK
ncbi:response regulator [Ammoniphilus sp. YIM 78166]|uniref:response regulator n=1 Tax=Ammoniphilus sp. YIM 78166 TaxID=1644106 RepID=UPI001F0E8A21|nr:response regulator [Ammoniphilus sp. YIM 78166]